MIIKLIQPKMNKRPMDTNLKTRMSPSLGLLTIANIIGDQHKVIIENENIEKINFSTPVDLVGITVTVDVMPRAIEIAKKYKEKGIKVVAGGIHITANPESAKDYFDVICVGMAEGTWPTILKDAQNHCLKKEYYCSNMIQGKDIVSPAYGKIDKSKYLFTNIISTSRGCPFQCDFCYNSCNAYKKLYINRPVKDVVDEIKSMKTKHIMFIDDNFIGNPQWTKELLNAIKPLNLKWNAAVSANIINMPDLLDDMKYSGCKSLFIGIESLNSNAIDNVHKKQNDVKNFEKMIEEIHKRGIMVNASFVFGLDGDDSSTFKSTIEWIVKNKIETVTSHILTPYPGTNLYNSFKENGRITCNDLSKYNTANVVFKPKNMTADELYNGYLSVYKEVYSFKNIIRRLPKCKSQWAGYLAFNFLYRKFGKLTEKICNIFSYYKIGKLSEKVSYKTE